ncbi:MAG: ROK family transcriptional regulator [Streptosporangiaceae bacterium]
MRRNEGAATTSAELRTHNLARLLRAVHDGGGQLTRAELTRQLSLARGTATVLVRDLAGRQLIEELSSPADAPKGLKVPRTRGRPTGVPSAHPRGPVALAVDLRDDSFTTAIFELTGRCTVLDRREREAVSGAGMLAEVADRLKIYRREFGDRIVGVGVAVPSPVSAGQMVQPTLPDWQDLDVAGALGAIDEDEGLILVGNDATLAGLAEARRGVLRGVSVALHLHVATGIGGVLLAGGQPVTGAHGSAGEFGHMPLTGGSEPCRCGSVGCWELDAGARGLLRAVGQSEEGDRMVRAEQIIAAAGTDPGCGQALDRAAGALGRGIGALVNAQDPEAVGLSGLAAEVYEAAPAAVQAGYLATLMRFRRAAPPALLSSTLGDLGALTGASELVFDAFLTARGLGGWPAPEQKTA